MPKYYSIGIADTAPPRSIYIKGLPNWYKRRVDGDSLTADKSFSLALEARGFYVDLDQYTWHGPRGQVFSIEFVEHVDKNYSWETAANIIRAIDMGAKSVNLRWNGRMRKYDVLPQNW